MTDLEILVAARELLSNKARWTQDYWAADKAGKEVWITSSEAVCFCAEGACFKAQRFSGDLYVPTALYDAAVALFDQTVVVVNDFLGYEATLQMFDSAIELAQAPR